MVKIKEAIIVEGRYDKNTVSQVVDTLIIETGGFGIFSDEEKLKMIRRIADKRGIIVLTDSDGAGFVIRNHLKGAVAPEKIKQAYIPDIYGKERRKRSPSKEGKLGVEGMKPETIIEALRRAGAAFENGADFQRPEDKVTKTDLYQWGFSGGEGSAERRKALISALDLPERLTSNALLDVINALYTRAEFERFISEHRL